MLHLRKHVAAPPPHFPKVGRDKSDGHEGLGHIRAQHNNGPPQIVRCRDTARGYSLILINIGRLDPGLDRTGFW